MFIIGTEKLSQTKLSHFAETKTKNVADGLAWGYYCGYLKLLLPHLDDVLEKAVAPDFVVENDDMKNAIQVKKLFIIISKNCLCYEKLINADRSIAAIFLHDKSWCSFTRISAVTLSGKGKRKAGTLCDDGIRDSVTHLERYVA